MEFHRSGDTMKILVMLEREKEVGPLAGIVAISDLESMSDALLLRPDFIIDHRLRELIDDVENKSKPPEGP